jgi:hypothetical protein
MQDARGQDGSPHTALPTPSPLSGSSAIAASPATGPPGSARIAMFGDPGLVTRFGLPPVLPERRVRTR